MPTGTPVLIKDQGFAIIYSPTQGRNVRICNDREIRGYICHGYLVETPKKVYWLYDIFCGGKLFARSMREDEFAVVQEV